ncbi:MAG: HlyC/CorC family transporter [bacterium]|nr:HlyC/CorC family transporter [bacterium]
MKNSTHSRFRLAAAVVLAVLIGGTSFAAGIVQPGAAAAEYTNMDVVLLVSYVLLALVFSFLCSVAEAVLLSVTPSYIEGMREKQPKKAAVLKKLKLDNVDRSLAAILTLNTIAHTVGAIGSGAKATAVFGSAWFGLFSAVMTLMILFLSEIIPKTLGAVYWPKLAGITAGFVRGLIVTLYPLILVSERLTKLITRGKGHHMFSRDEFIAMAGIGEKSGHINERESRIIRNLFRFESLNAKDIMTPRTVMVALSEEMTVTEALEANRQFSFSRLPLYQKDIDDITGFILKDDLLLQNAKCQGNPEQNNPIIKSLKRDILTVPAEMPLSALLESLLAQRRHIALVAGEYGGTKGLVTLEDVVETLLGMEIVDEQDTVEDMQSLARQQWEKRAKALGLDVKELDEKKVRKESKK